MKQSQKLCIYIVMFLCIILSLPIMTIYYNNRTGNIYSNDSIAVSANNIKDNSKAYNIDLNGDGKKDILYIEKNTNGKLSASIYSNNSKNTLLPNSPLNSIGTNDSCVNCNFLDLTRDNVPEIIIQSFDNNTPIQHIFNWNKKKYSDIFASTNNSLGILDLNSNRTPRIISFNINEPMENIKEYMFIKDKFKDISYNKSTVYGYSIVQKFIDTIELSYELDECPDIFNEDIDYYSKSLLWKLSKNDFYYEFKDCFFNDTQYSNKGIPIEYQWNIRFLRTSKKDKNNSSIVSFNVKIRKYNNDYKINSISMQ